MRPHSTLLQRPETNIAVVTHSAFLWFTLTCFGNVSAGCFQAWEQGQAFDTHACMFMAGCLCDWQPTCCAWLCPHPTVAPPPHLSLLLAMPSSCNAFFLQEFAKPVRENLQRWYEVRWDVQLQQSLT